MTIDRPDANFISDRSGFKHKRRDAVIEPGTGYIIHRRESDGIYNAVDHPQAHLNKWAKLSGDPVPIKNARPQENSIVDLYLTDEDGNVIINELGQPLEVF